jgi:hypothetical protein
MAPPTSQTKRTAGSSSRASRTLGCTRVSVWMWLAASLRPTAFHAYPPPNSHPAQVDTDTVRPGAGDPKLRAQMAAAPADPIVGIVGRVGREKGISGLRHSGCRERRRRHPRTYCQQLVVTGRHSRPGDQLTRARVGPRGQIRASCRDGFRRPPTGTVTALASSLVFGRGTESST